MGNPDGRRSLNVHYISALYPETTRNTLYLFIIYLSKEEHYQCLGKRTLERVKRFGLLLGDFEEGFWEAGLCCPLDVVREQGRVYVYPKSYLW